MLRRVCLAILLLLSVHQAAAQQIEGEGGGGSTGNLGRSSKGLGLF